MEVQMMKRRAVYGVVMGILVLSGISGWAGPFTAKDNGREVNVPIDDVFEIELEGNITTGYTWENVSESSGAVEQVGEAEYKAAGNRLGSGGIFTFKFKAAAAGSAVIKLVYHRTFEKDAPPADTFEMKIVVGMMGQILD
ncbi:MAG: hypothetical protein EOM20_09395 [Spartobacteria bacterium]|nr:hypothetical protein [Spartobacteria bacterium]